MTPSPPPYPWYTIVEATEPLTQGDFIQGCPILIPPATLPKEGESMEKLPIQVFDVVVLTQACDLARDKVSIVTVCPFFPLAETKDGYLKSSDGKKALRQGYLPGYHLLNKCDFAGFEQGFNVVDFRSIYGSSLSFLKEFVPQQGPRLRLLPPYREQLSQSFARFFMRVGLPIDIEGFK